MMSWFVKLLRARCLVSSLIVLHVLRCHVAVAVLPPASTVIGDFENGSFDGWDISSDGVLLGHTSTGATLGNSALTMNIPAPGFYFPVHRADTSLFPAMLNATSLTMDITYDRSLFAGSHDAGRSFAFIGLAISTPAGYFQGSASYDNHSPPAFGPGFWDNNDTTTYPNNVNTRTVTFDFTQDIETPILGGAHWLTAMDAIQAAGEDYLNFFLVFNAGDGFTSPTLIVDNIRLNTVPEPGAFVLALLGFPTLWLVARNRRCSCGKQS
jgi:hypothetical protein